MLNYDKVTTGRKSTGTSGLANARSMISPKTVAPRFRGMGLFGLRAYAREHAPDLVGRIEERIAKAKAANCTACERNRLAAEVRVELTRLERESQDGRGENQT